ncbi:hypothetical protein QR680_016375 [Steinernema hermaphroditum]|uniref:Uncharacterized protein n=1 Tax=Steinernema hermaphroditum TaxID=289476 RepID=A0AA39HB13_9BILA|nr:hypothetical protein QR680_016375 [Steinernema hermaphroditum]
MANSVSSNIDSSAMEQSQLDVDAELFPRQDVDAYGLAIEVSKSPEWVLELLRRFRTLHPLTENGYGRRAIVDLSTLLQRIEERGVRLSVIGVVRHFTNRLCRRRRRQCSTSLYGAKSRDRVDKHQQLLKEKKESVPPRTLLVPVPNGEYLLHHRYRSSDGEFTWLAANDPMAYNVTDSINHPHKVLGRCPLPDVFKDEADFDAMVEGYNGPTTAALPLQWEDRLAEDFCPSPTQRTIIRNFARLHPLVQHRSFYELPALIGAIILAHESGIPRTYLLRVARLFWSKKHFARITTTEEKKGREEAFQVWLQNHTPKDPEAVMQFLELEAATTYIHFRGERFARGWEWRSQPAPSTQPGPSPQPPTLKCKPQLRVRAVSPSRGEGVFSNEDIPASAHIAKYEGYDFRGAPEDVRRITDEVEQVTSAQHFYNLLIEKNRVILPQVESYINGRLLFKGQLPISAMLNHASDTEANVQLKMASIVVIADVANDGTFKVHD